jgi:hypothetical protein
MARALIIRSLCHLEVIHASDMLNDGEVRLGFHGQVRLDLSWPGAIYIPAMLLHRVAFPDFCEPGLPSPADKPPAGAGWLHEIKHDGPAPTLRCDARGGHGCIRQQWRRE